MWYHSVRSLSADHGGGQRSDVCHVGSNRAGGVRFACLGMFSVFALLELFVIGVGLGIGFLLNWLLPAIGAGSGAVVGVIATGIAMYVFTRIITAPSLIDDTDTDVIVDSPTQVFISSLEAFPTGPRRKPPAPREVGRKSKE